MMAWIMWQPPKSLPLLIAAVFVVSPAFAQSSATAPDLKNSPIEVTAEQSLEWHQDAGIYVARGKAKAVRGDLVIEADLLTAHQRAQKTPQDKSAAGLSGDIDQLTAEGNVHITDPRQQVFGEKGVYDLDRRVAILTGDNLKYQTAKETVTATESLEFYELDGKAIARGNAVALQNNRRVEAPLLTAQFATGADGSQQLQTITAEGGVTIITGTDIAKGEQAVYDLQRDIAVLTGNVRVNRAGTQLAGDKAEVEFKTGQSRLLNHGSGRVRALLVPVKDKRI